MLENVLYIIRYEVWNRLYHVIRGKSDHVTYFQSKQVKMATFNESEAAAGNDELYLAS
jgi:hypothetical protein